MRHLFIPVFLISSFLSFAQTGNRKADSLLAVVAKTPTDTGRVSLYVLIASIPTLKTEFAFHYADSAVFLSEESNDPKYKGSAYRAKGDILQRRAGGDTALPYLQTALENYKAAKYNYGITLAHYSIGNCYSQQDHYPEALRAYQECEKYAEQANSPRYVAYARNGMGTIHMMMRNYEEATKKHKQALEAAEKIDDNKLLGWTYTCLGNVLVNQGKYEEALAYFHKAEETYSKTDYLSGVAGAHNNMGACYSYLKRYEDAIVQFKLAAALKEKLGELAGMGIAYLNIAETYSALGQFKLAEAYARKSLALARQTGSLLDEASAYSALATTFHDMGLDDSAYFYSLKYKRYSDSVYSQSTKDQLAELQAGFENEKNRTRIEVLEKDKKIGKLWSTVMGVGIFLVLALVIFIYGRYRVRTRANQMLALQNAQISTQKKEITDSINYAQRIQQALLASDKMLEKHLGDYFIYYQPKAIVSGDFYWAIERDGAFYFAVCDSTGHGVPGAFMSLLNISFLNEAISEKGITKPGEVFNHARQRLLENLPAESQDGMDGDLLRIENGKITFAAAHCNPVLFHKGSMTELAADNMPVGKSPKEQKDFQTYDLPFSGGDLLYLFTDGFADQFGGGRAGGKKFMYKNMLRLLGEIHHLPLAEQKKALEQKHHTWRGELEQLDDILVVGIRLGNKISSR
jgi:serine phosphatase RsbU (regulator of sigma subunit)